MSRLLVTGVGGASGYAVGSLADGLGIDTLWGDSDPDSPALLSRPDLAVSLPMASADHFLDELLEACKSRGVTHLSPNVDAEISRLGRPDALNLKTLVSTWMPSDTAIGICIDKRRFSKFVLEHTSLQTPGSHAPAAIERCFPDEGVFVKPRFGSGATGTRHCRSVAELRAWLTLFPGALVQEFIAGEEFSADCLFEYGKEPLVYLRRRTRTKAGMSTVSESFVEPSLASEIQSLLRSLSLSGPTCVQGFTTDRGYIFTEVNVRFGGGCALASHGDAGLVELYLHRLLGGDYPDIAQFSYKPGRKLIRPLDFSIIEAAQ